MSHRSNGFILLVLLLVLAGCRTSSEPAGEIIVLSHYPNPNWESPVVEAIAAVEGQSVTMGADGAVRVTLPVGPHTAVLTEYADHDATVQRLRDTASPPMAALLVVSGVEGLWQEQHGAQLRHAKEAGVPIAAVLISQVQAVDDEELLQLIEDPEVKNALEAVGYAGVPVIRGSAVKVVEGEAAWRGSIEHLVSTLRQRIEPALAAR